MSVNNNGHSRIHISRTSGTQTSASSSISRTSTSNATAQANGVATQILSSAQPATGSSTSPVNIPRPRRHTSDRRSVSPPKKRGETPGSPPAVIFVVQNGEDALGALASFRQGLINGTTAINGTTTISATSSASPTSSPSNSATFESDFDIANSEYERIQKKNNIQLTALFIQKLIHGDLHVHFEGLLSPDQLFKIAMKMDQIHWDIRDKIFVSLPNYPKDPKDPKDPRYIRLKEIKDQSIINYSYSEMQAKSNPEAKVTVIESTVNFFKAFGLRENLMNQIGLAGLFPLVYEHLQEQGNRYVELMTVLNYKEVPARFEAMFKDMSHEAFLNHPEVQAWIDADIKESQATLDACKENLNRSHTLSASQTLENPTVERFKIDQSGEKPLTIRFSIEVMRTDPPWMFFVRAASACKLIAQDPRVVSFTICGLQSDLNAMHAIPLKSQIIRFLSEKHGEKFKFNPHFAETKTSRSAVIEEWNQFGKWATRRCGHAVDGFHLAEEMKRKDVAVEACLCSNQASLQIDYEEHPLHAYLETGVRAVFGSDDPGVIDKSIIQNLVYAINKNRLSFEQFLDCIRATATYSHLEGESIYETRSTVLKEMFWGHVYEGSALEEEAQNFLRTSERAQLELLFESRIREFISSVAAEVAERSS